MPQRADAPIRMSVDLDDTRKWNVQLRELEETTGEWGPSIIWKFTVHDIDTGVSLIDNNSGSTWLFWQFTDDKMYSNKNTGKKAKAREYTEALLGRELTDDEVNRMIDDGTFATSLIGRKGLADLEWYVNQAGQDRVRILKLRPYREAAAPAPAPAARPGGRETGAERAARLRRELEQAELEDGVDVPA